MAKNTNDTTTCQVLPFLLDISLALYDTLDLVKSSVDSEVVFQATLQVPAHHSLACKLQAYGTPFAAPDLQAAAGDLADADLEFAACIAAPPDLDEQMSMNIGRVLSMLEHNRAGQVQAGPVARAAAPAAQQQQAPSGGGATTAAQQLRATNMQQQAAPKVLVSVDDAEAGSAQLQRNNSAKKGPRFLARDTGFGKRAMQALLGFGYLLTVLHEKHLGGRIEFTASALTAATASTPATSNSHMRHRNSFSSSGGSRGQAGMLAGLRKAIQECPSLSPGSFTTVRRSAGGPAGAAPAAAAAAAAATGSPVFAGNLGQQQQQQAGPFAAASAGSSLEKDSSFEVVWQRINSPTRTPGSAVGRGALQGLSVQLSLSAPLNKACSSSLARVLEEEMQQANGKAAVAAGAAVVKESRSVGGDGDDSAAAAAAVGAACLAKEPVMGRSGNMERLLDEALEQLAEVDPDAVGLPSAAAAGGAGHQGLQANEASLGGKGCIESPFSSYQNLQTQDAGVEAAVAGADALRSHYLPDQGCLTSPLPSRADKPAAAAAAAIWGSLPPTPNRPPPCPLSNSTAAAAQRQQQPGSPFTSARAAAITAAAAAAASLGGASSSSSSAVTPGSSPHGSSGGFAAAAAAAAAAPVSPFGPRSPTILRPMMSMRLTCQPKWQFNEALLQPNSSSSKAAATAAAAAAASCSPDSAHTPLLHQQQDAARTPQQQQQRRKAVIVHEGDDAAESDVVPSGLWPTVSFSLAPVRITPSRCNQQQHQPAYATGRA